MKNLWKIVLAFVAFTFVAAAPMRAMAQDVEAQEIESLDLEQADIRDALTALFKNVSVSYQVSPEVQGTVTLKVVKKPFKTVLEAILKQADATYRIEGGIYNIVKKADIILPTDSGPLFPTNVNSSLTVTRIKINHADPGLIFYLLLSGTSFQVNARIPSEITLIGGGGFGGGGGFSNNNQGGGGGITGGVGGGGFSGQTGGGGGGAGGGGGGRGGGAG